MQENLSQAIHIINPDRGVVPSGFVDKVDGEVGYGIGATAVPTTVTVGYDTQRRDEDNPDCYCKFVITQESPSYYIKADMNNRIANPWEAITSLSQDNRFSKRTGRPAWKFVSVNKECFDLYLRFLETRNTTYYYNCERLFRNG